jgi:hypothetical protein
VVAGRRGCLNREAVNERDLGICQLRLPNLTEFGIQGKSDVLSSLSDLNNMIDYRLTPAAEIYGKKPKRGSKKRPRLAINAKALRSS